MRNVVREWLDTETCLQLSRAGIRTSPFSLREEKAWARKLRRGNATGYTRTYRCNNADQNLELEIRTNASDDTIQYYAFRVNEKYISGGAADVKSVFSTGKSTAVKAKLDEDIFVIKSSMGKFRRLSESQLNKLNTLMTHGEGAFDTLFEEREA